MKHIDYFPVVLILLLVACKEGTNSNKLSTAKLDTIEFKKEIPVYKDKSLNISYLLAKTKQNQLKLDSLENGFDSLQIRIWYDYTITSERKLVVIANRELTWTAEVFDLQVDWNGETETILSKKMQYVTPKSGWANFSKQLLDLNIMTLPNQHDIPEYGGGLDGVTYNVEVATKKVYRFYGYWWPEVYKDKIWQAKNMVDILKLLENELGVQLYNLK